MDRYNFNISYRKADTQRSLILQADASSDDEAIRIAHPLADVLEFDGGSAIEIEIEGLDARKVATLSDAFDGQRDNYVERSHMLGSGYRPTS